MLENMISFFEKRVNGYDEHMLSGGEGCKEGYIQLAQLVPKKARNLLDLGCGTGLELDEVFRLIPNIQVTGIDLTAAMLEQLSKKYKNKSITLINSDYFKQDFENDCYDAVISCQTMHHFAHNKKID